MSFAVGGRAGGQIGSVRLGHPLRQVCDLHALERLQRGRFFRRCRRAQREQGACIGVLGDRSRVGPDALVELGTRGDDHLRVGQAQQRDRVLSRQ